MAREIPFIPGSKQYRIAVSDDSSQQNTLSALVGPRRQERLNIKVRAHLALQDDEPEILVSINGKQVGHLTRASAQALRRIVRYGERSPHESFECAALIHGVVGQLGVRLDLPLED